jgi:hypothetical protein
MSNDWNDPFIAAYEAAMRERCRLQRQLPPLFEADSGRLDAEQAARPPAPPVKRPSLMARAWRTVRTGIAPALVAGGIALAAIDNMLLRVGNKTQPDGDLET